MMNIALAFLFYAMGMGTAIGFNWFAWRRYREARNERKGMEALKK